MPLPKQPVSVFVGATDQDTSRKGVKLANLISAVNTRQVKGGEFSKRDGFTATAQVYEGVAGIVPDSIVSPDGIQTVTRDAITDKIFVRSTSTVNQQDQGTAERFWPRWETRSPATETGQQSAPMPKQAGPYMVHLLNEQTFRVSVFNPASTVLAKSPTRDSDALIATHDIVVPPGAGGGTAHVKSFAIVDASDWDGSNLWILWVDWDSAANRGAVFALKCPHNDISSTTFYTVYEWGAGIVLTGISAGVVSGGNKLFVCACGLAISGGPVTGFRSGSVTDHPAWNHNSSAAYVHFYMSPSGVASGTTAGTLASDGKHTASGISLISVGNHFQTSAQTIYYAWLCAGAAAEGKAARLVVMAVDKDTMNSATYSYSLPGWDTLATDPLPENWSPVDYSMNGFFTIGSITGREVSTGLQLVISARPYWFYSENSALSTQRKFYAWNPDRITTMRVDFAASGGTFTKVWEARGSWLAQGWVRLRNYAGAVDDGTDYAITGYEDDTALQCAYHVRRWADGAIVAQVAYGEGAHVGNCATRDGSVQGHCHDINQPMLNGHNPYIGNPAYEVPTGLPIGLQSANVNGSVDVARLLLINWDFEKGAAIPWQPAQPFRSVVLSSGPIPFSVGGFQRVREAGPLVFPSRPEAYEGAGSS